MSGHFERLRGWSRGCTPNQECCRLPLTYCWVTWHQSRALLISVNNEKLWGWLVWKFRKVDVSGHFERFRGWCRGCTPPQECCRLPLTYFWVTWQHTRAFLISVKNEKWFFWQIRQLWPRRCVWAFWVLAIVTPWLHSASGMLHTTIYLLLGPMRPNLGILYFNENWKVIFLAVSTILQNETCLGILSARGVILWLHSALGMLQTTASLLLGHMASN